MRDLEDNGAYCFVPVGQALEQAAWTAGLARDISLETESPIEVIFGVAATRVLSKPHNRLCPQFEFRRSTKADVDRVEHERVLMIPQFWWNNYRIDWAFHVNFLTQPWVFVECDGRDFHSSDEQIMRDAKRDAKARDAGIPVLRFSGSDIHRNADACASAVLWEVDAQYRSRLLEWHKRRRNGSHS